MPVAPVSHLLSEGCPSYVSRLVVPVIVDSVNRMFWRGRLADISQEVFKIHPALTQFNSTACVTVKFLSLQIRATCLHIGPSAVDFCSGHSMFQSVATVADTAAGNCYATTKRISSDPFLIATTASAKPFREMIDDYEMI